MSLSCALGRPLYERMVQRAADRSGSLVESHKGYDPRIIFFYFIISGLLLVLIGGLAYQQLIRADAYRDAEKKQTQRRILIPGPRGSIFDRNGRLLAGNRPRFSVVLYLDELRQEFRRENIRVVKNYREMVGNDLPNADRKEQLQAYRAKQREKEVPSDAQLLRIARYSVVQSYLDQINRALGRQEKVNGQELEKHFVQQLLLPYVLLDDLTADEYAKLIEQLPVRSPLQVYASSSRQYPYGSTAAHTLGFVKVLEDIDVGEDFPGAQLTTFKVKGVAGRDGLERQFEKTLQGETGGSIYRVDPAGYRIDPPLDRRRAVAGNDLVSSLDLDLQQAAEKAITETEMAGAAVAFDVKTGEVLVLASKPDYDLGKASPRMSFETAGEIESKGAWLHRAIQGLYPPGSSFKILVTIAGMRAGAIAPDSEVDCPGFYRVGKKEMPCHDRHAHGHILLAEAIEKSCNVFFYKHGLEMGAEAIIAEARRFGFDRGTGIELPHETRGMNVPDAEWKRKITNGPWVPIDTANISIGQGGLAITPLQMGAFIASFARRETRTVPHLLHVANRPAQHTESIGLTPAQYDGIVAGMEQCVLTGTARSMKVSKLPAGLRVAGKTGTAQQPTPKGTINIAWFICFAPIEKPEIAIAVMIEGDTPGEETGGGRYAVPVAGAILKTWSERPKVAGPTGR
jgi:penicillin-binding protein 2